MKLNVTKVDPKFTTHAEVVKGKAPSATGKSIMANDDLAICKAPSQ